MLFNGGSGIGMIYMADGCRKRKGPRVESEIENNPLFVQVIA